MNTKSPLSSPSIALMRRLVILCTGLVVLVSAGVFFTGIAPLWHGDSRSLETVPVVLGLGILGCVLLALERGYQKAAWVAVVPALLGLVALIEAHLGITSGLDAGLTHPLAGEGGLTAGHMPMIAAITLILIGGLLPWLTSSAKATSRLFALALAGSVLGSVGITMLVGNSLHLLVGSRIGSDISLPPLVSLLMLLSGCAALLLAWAQHRQVSNTQPSWLPLPVIFTCGMCTVALWLGVREREITYFNSNTQLMIDSLAGSINSEFELQTANVARMSRRWAVEGSESIWAADSVAWLTDVPSAHALMQVGSLGETVWYYPLSGNVHLNSLNHFKEVERRTALRAVALSGDPQISGTLLIAGRSSGYVIYTPLYRASILEGFIGAEFTYQRFFEVLSNHLLLGTNYRYEVYLGDDCLYTSLNQVTHSLQNALRVESEYMLKNRRLRIVMEPSDEFVQNNRRYIPELLLAAGMGITLLSGLSVHLACTARAGLAEAKNTNHLLGLKNDESRRVEAMLKVSDERLRLALDATGIGVFEWDCRNDSLHISSSLWAMLGRLTKDEFTTQEVWKKLIHTDDLPAYQAALDAQLVGGQSFIDSEYRIRTESGIWRWVYMRSKTVHYAETGNPLRIVGSIQDITARRMAEQALQGSQSVARKLSLVASRTDNPVFLIKPDGTIEWVNESFERVTEYSSNEVVGLDPTTLMTGPETNLLTLRRIRAAMTQGQSISTDIVIYSKSGRKYHLQLELQPIRDNRGEIENFIVIEADITARVETEKALRRAKAEADSASRAKSDFLASMSHEIRTPMNGVIGMTSLLLESSLTPEQRDSVSTIRTSGEVLLAIINDLLDFSKIESGNTELEYQSFDLARCIEETLELFSGQAAARRLEVAYSIDPAVPSVFMGDVNRIRQILANLINNAVKFTPAGSVDLTVRLSSAEAEGLSLMPEHVLVLFTIHDTGIGIPPESLERLFKPFSQVDSSTTRKYGGTGLGLAICQRLCVLMGGKISVVSEPNQGTSFTFVLQLVPAAVDVPALVLPSALKAAPVLCIDDNPVNLDRLVTFFRSSGGTVLTASDVQSAFPILRQNYPSLVVLDLELTGFEESGTLAELLVRSETPVIGLLSSALDSSPDWVAQLRFAALARPWRTQALHRALAAIFPSSSGAVAVIPPEHAPNLATQIPLRVLLVEDNPVNQRVALRFLAHLGYSADAVVNGIEAITALESHAYHLVFMDLQMPEMDGYTATRHVRKSLPAEQQPCIIALTANALQDDREQCLAAGMNDFITKPIQLADLSDVIRRNFPSGTPFA
jgi:PAS domain S-box-containing protein